MLDCHRNSLRSKRPIPQPINNTTSEKVVIPIPDEAGYRKLVAKYLGKTRLANELTIDALTERVAGMAPADLEATIQSMKRVAMRRMNPTAKELPPLCLSDLKEAVGRVQPRF